MCEFKTSDVIAINRNISVQRESGSEAIRVDLRCCYFQLSSWSGGVDVGLSWVKFSWLFQRVFSWRGAEQLMVKLLDGWRRCSECLVTAELSCELSGSRYGTYAFYCRVNRLYCYRGQRSAEYLPSRVRWVLLFIGDFDFTVRSV